MDPQEFADRILDDIEVSMAEAWDASSKGEFDRLRSALNDIVAHAERWKSGPENGESHE